MAVKRIEELLTAALAAKGMDMKEASLKIGKNHAYLQQFLKRGIPASLPEDVREKLGELLSLNPDELRDSPGRGHKTSASTLSKLRQQIARIPGGLREDRPAATNATIVELEVNAAAGAGALVEYEDPVGEWSMPAGVLREHTRAPTSALRFITVIGESMLPDLPPGTKVLVNTQDRNPSPPGVFVLYDGVGTLVKNIEVVKGKGPVRVRIFSNNPRFSESQQPLADTEILGRVIARWTWM